MSQNRKNTSLLRGLTNLFSHISAPNMKVENAMLTVTKQYKHGDAAVEVSLAGSSDVAVALESLDQAALAAGLESIALPKRRVSKKKAEEQQMATGIAPEPTINPAAIGTVHQVPDVAPPAMPQQVSMAPTPAVTLAPVATPTPVAAAPMATPAPAPAAAPQEPAPAAPVEPIPTGAAPSMEETDAMATGWRESIKGSLVALKGELGVARHGDIDALYLEALRQIGVTNLTTVEQADTVLDQLGTQHLQPVYQFISNGASRM